MREIKFRAWADKEMHYFDLSDTIAPYWEDCIMQYTGLKDKNGKEIYEGDILEFADKWEWYKGRYGIKMIFADAEERARLKKEYKKEPMERRTIELPLDYEWILSPEIQTYWQVIGNIHENPELL